jgi:hypothetical protein
MAVVVGGAVGVAGGGGVVVVGAVVGAVAVVVGGAVGGVVAVGVGVGGVVAVVVGGAVVGAVAVVVGGAVVVQMTRAQKRRKCMCGCCRWMAYGDCGCRQPRKEDPKIRKAELRVIRAAERWSYSFRFTGSTPQELKLNAAVQSYFKSRNKK